MNILLKNAPAILTLALTQIPLTAQIDQLGQQAKAIMDARVKSIVTVNVVLKMEMMGKSHEHRLDARGVVVSPQGLIMTRKGIFSPSLSSARNGEKPKFTPLDIKVVFNNEEKEYQAFLVGKDSKLRLAFIQIQEELPDELELAPIDFAGKTKPVIGEQVVTVLRLDKNFDYAPMFTATRILGHTKKPRKAFLVGGQFPPGLPVFNLSGEVLGFHTVLEDLSGSHQGYPVILTNNIAKGAIGNAQKRAIKMLAEGGGKADDEADDEAAAEAEPTK